jgi:hypothetical protein
VERIGSDWLGGLYTGSERRAKVRHIKVFFIGMDRRALEVSGAVCRGLERIGKHNKVFFFAMDCIGALR